METERQLKDLGQILKYAEQYQSNHIYHIRYRKSKDPDAYLRHHETELLLHDGAENMLKRFGISLKHLILISFVMITMLCMPRKKPCRKPINLLKRHTGSQPKTG